MRTGFTFVVRCKSFQPASVLLIKPLLLLGGRPEFFRRNDGRDHRSRQALLRNQHHARMFSRRFLVVRMIENHGSELRADIAPLPAHLRRVVAAPKHFQKLAILHLDRIVFDVHNLGMAGIADGNGLGRWSLGPAAHVARTGPDHAANFAKDFLDVPKLSGAKGRPGHDSLSSNSPARSTA